MARSEQRRPFDTEPVQVNQRMHVLFSVVLTLIDISQYCPFKISLSEIKEPHCHSVSNSKCLKTSQHITNWGHIDDFSVYRFSLYESVEQQANFMILFFELHI